MKSTKRSFSPDDTARILDNIKKEPEPIAYLSLQDLLQGDLGKELKRRLLLGATYEEICALLQKQKISISSGSLRKYLSSPKRPSPKRSASKRLSNNRSVSNNTSSTQAPSKQTKQTSTHKNKAKFGALDESV